MHECKFVKNPHLTVFDDRLDVVVEEERHSSETVCLELIHDESTQASPAGSPLENDVDLSPRQQPRLVVGEEGELVIVKDRDAKGFGNVRPDEGHCCPRVQRDVDRGVLVEQGDDLTRDGRDAGGDGDGGLVGGQSWARKLVTALGKLVLVVIRPRGSLINGGGGEARSEVFRVARGEAGTGNDGVGGENRGWAPSCMTNSAKVFCSSLLLLWGATTAASRPT